NQNELNNDNFGNQDDYENNTQLKDDIADDLNEPCEAVSNNELAVLNEGMHLPTISNNASEKMIQIPIETVDKFDKYEGMNGMLKAYSTNFAAQNKDLQS
ncbi:3138_t:CDS:2, partial [Gigaspora margarita]